MTVLLGHGGTLIALRPGVRTSECWPEPLRRTSRAVRGTYQGAALGPGEALDAASAVETWSDTVADAMDAARTVALNVAAEAKTGRRRDTAAVVPLRR